MTLKNPANMITICRIPLAAALVFAPPRTWVFWALYAAAGLSDLLDGAVARRLGCQTESGARLDSAADLCLAAAIAASAVRYFALPAWIWIAAAAAAAVRIAGYIAGYCRFREFPALHTRLNKAAGALIFASPILCAVFGAGIGWGIACVAALISAAEEAAINLTSDRLDRDCPGLFFTGRNLKEDQTRGTGSGNALG